MKERAPHTSRLVRACGANKNLLFINSDSDSEVRIFGCFVLDPCGSACCATSLNQRYPRISSTRYLQHLLLHARLHLTLLVHLLNWSPHLRHILILLLILFPILWWLIQRAGAPTVPAPASTLAPFGLEDHQVPSNSL
ncbi:hypothetical protein Lalb_Chr00c24g0406741 (mitochondrion) [Lupinus albus]|uniref:Uncharacterized protein n=1 Tax=Lupinus albus TaxID=3870 RepID=A0A6A4MIS4_LUPAL|nr:hypothetical protein Lalb_Chr00c24g0406741 [Lupinus albus]